MLTYFIFNENRMTVKEIINLHVYIDTIFYIYNKILFIVKVLFSSYKTTYNFTLINKINQFYSFLYYIYYILIDNLFRN